MCWFYQLLNRYAIQISRHIYYFRTGRKAPDNVCLYCKLYLYVETSKKRNNARLKKR